MVRFAQMGAAYARVVLDIEHPRVGLLANGTEDEKGSNFTKACFPAMKPRFPALWATARAPILRRAILTSWSRRYVGQYCAQGHRGAAKFLLQELKGAFMSSLGTKIAALLIKKQMRQIKAKLSGDAKGGAILLGLRGVVLIGTVPRRSRPSRTVRLPRPRPCAPGLSRTLPILWTVSFYKGRVTWLNLYRVG